MKSDGSATTAQADRIAAASATIDRLHGCELTHAEAYLLARSRAVLAATQTPVEPATEVAMAMACERTVWADGMGLTQDRVEALTLIAEEADARLRTMADRSGNLKLGINLAPSDIWSEWPAELETMGFEDLAAKVRTIETT